MRVCIVQADNRPALDYLQLTKKVNKIMAAHFNYDYQFVQIQDEREDYCDPFLHPASKKIYVVDDFLQKKSHDIMVFLDSDAWIQNGTYLEEIITKLAENPDKHGCFSRDPYAVQNTYINSGSFILKVNDYTQKMYKHIIWHLSAYTLFHHIWPFDQHYVSEFVLDNRDKFYVFVPDVLNTPTGRILRHNWHKTVELELNTKVITDQSRQEREETERSWVFEFDACIDMKSYPN
jgi:hypothetical protein